MLRGLIGFLTIASVFAAVPALAVPIIDKSLGRPFLSCSAVLDEQCASFDPRPSQSGLGSPSPGFRQVW